MLTVHLVDNSDLVREALPEQIEQALIAVGMAAESNAKMEITHAVYDQPEARSGYVRTGRLRSSLTYEPLDGEQAVLVGTDVGYAKFVEAGTMKMPARPFLRPAIVDHVDEYKALIQEALSK